MLQTSSLKLVFLSLIITSFSACGLLKKSNKTKEEPKTKEVVKETVEEIKEEEPQLILPKLVEMNTNYGKIIIKIYEGTPLHRENFAKLIAQNYYDGLLFHRVIKDFMIQAGDPNSKNAPLSTPLGNGGPSYTVPAEISQKFYHKKGALCAARQGDNVNPEQRSSGSQFYFVTGAVYSIGDLQQMENRINQQAKSGLMRKYWNDPKNKKMSDLYARYNTERKMDSLSILKTKIMNSELSKYIPYKFTEEQVKTYTTEGGTPFLDNNYTVFGEVVEGIDIVEEIGKLNTKSADPLIVNQPDRPIEDVKIISIKILE
jgi:cyclophilin family peptidyl-prolyl cis-trans isomerase